MDNKDNKKIEAKRVVAMICVILLVLLVIATIVTALLDFPGSEKVFFGMIGLDIIVPVLLWFYMYLYKRAGKTDDEINKKMLEDAKENQDK